MKPLRKVLKEVPRRNFTLTGLVTPCFNKGYMEIEHSWYHLLHL